MAKSTDVGLLDREQELVDRLTLIGQALGDPIRVRMLRLMARGRQSGDFPNLGLRLPLEMAGLNGISVSEFMAYYHMGQSKVSYHIRVLKEAGLVVENMRGKWTFYSLNPSAVHQAQTLLHDVLLEA